MAAVTLSSVKKYMDTTLVLKNISFMVNEGEKVGIVGENGSGKSTIIKLIAGVLTLNHCAGYPYAPTPLGYDEGWVIVPKELSRAYLDQLPDYPRGVKVLDVLNMAFEEAYRIEHKMRAMEEELVSLEGKELERRLRSYSELQQLYELKGGYETQEKLSRIIKGLNFSESFLEQEFWLLSGGEKTTVVLGKLLMDNPDILLLDEPTNHLDMQAVEWLEEYLRNYRGTVLIVSHDRYFLDHVVTKIVEIEDKEADTYQGNYTDYTNAKAEKLRIQYENYKEQQKKMNAMEKSIKDLRDWAMRADNNKFFQRAASMQIRLDKMERIDKPSMERQNMRLDFHSAERSGNITMKAVALSKSFEEKLIFKEADLLINYGERIGLIGPNGCGKTTFLRMLLGEELPDSGVVQFGANVKPGYLPQKLSFTQEEMTVLECFREDLFILEGKAREYLARFMFYGGNVFKKIKHLSGGERIRLKLAIMLYQEINLLILDEPTNHLDTASIETIETALENFKGTILFISHDRYFLNKMAERIIAVEDYTFRSYSGNYDYYKQVQEEQKQQSIIQTELSSRKQVKGDTRQRASETARVPNKSGALGLKKDDGEQENKEGYKKDITKPCKSNQRTEKKSDQTGTMGYKETQLIHKIELLEKELKETEALMEAANMDHQELHRLYLHKETLSKELELYMEQWLS